jgi:hypothetical protein
MFKTLELDMIADNLESKGDDEDNKDEADEKDSFLLPDLVVDNATGLSVLHGAKGLGSPKMDPALRIAATSRVAATTT